jgi:hypothetical protein
MQNQEIGPQRRKMVGDFLELREDQHTGSVCVVHIPTGVEIRRWTVVTGMEEAIWELMTDCCTHAEKLTAVNWHTDDIDFLFPSQNFVTRYLDPVGLEDKTVEEVSAELMEKVLKNDGKLG